MNDFAVRYSIFDRFGRIRTIEKSFKTDKARTAYLERAERKDNFMRLIAYSDPQTLNTGGMSDLNDANVVLAIDRAIDSE